MKYGKLLLKIKNINLFYIDYNYLKKKIFNENFINIFINNIDFFDSNYKLQKVFNENIYEYLIINYLSIHKLLKKFNKKTFSNFKIDLSTYKFYKDIINPKYFVSNSNSICPICLDHNRFMVETDCKHKFCFSCMIQCSNNFNNCAICRTNTILDPVLIYINNIIDNKDNKYSPFQNNPLSIDLISDLHIDQWSNHINIKYPYGEKKHIPAVLHQKSDILVIAGDISDDLELSLNYINKLSEKYNKILFVDGNHEHVNAYPKLYSNEYINEKVKLLNNDKIIYLPSNEYIIDDIVFIGFCGWWDYNNEKNKKLSVEYFKKWIPNFTKQDNLDFIDNVLQKAKEEYQKMNELIQKYEKDNKINKIILVTHSVGHKDFKVVNKDTDYNTMFDNIYSEKIKYWLFGHTHYEIDYIKNKIHFICNPRGRPDDFNREKYSLKTINI